jgi:hypothetical protein
MGNLTTVTGEIHITPPLTWKEIRAKDYTDGYHEGTWGAVILSIASEATETDEGTVTTREGVAILPAVDDKPYKAYNLEARVQAIIQHFPGHDFNGYLECLGEEGELWRVYAKGRKTRKVKPEIVWPED